MKQELNGLLSYTFEHILGQQKTTMSDIKTHFRNCNLCEAMCGIEVQTQENKVVSIRGDKKDPFSQGYICPKATALQDIYNDPDRLKQPLKRTKDGFKQISWEEAFDEVACNIKRIQQQYGKDAVSVYLGNPNVHNYGALLYGLPAIKSLRTKNRFAATSIDQLPHHMVGYFMFGHQLLLPVPDIDRTDFFLILGGNPVVSNGSIMSAPGVPRRLKEIRKRGGKVVVIDPRFTETAKLASEHHFIRPGTDVLLVLALLNVLFKENLVQMGKLEHFCTGLEEIKNLVSSYTPEKVAAITGIEADIIYKLAREFATANAAVCYGRMGTCTQEFGAITQWLIMVFNILTGNLDKPGGFMFTSPAIDIVAMSAKQNDNGGYARWHSRVRKLPEFGNEFPVATLAEEILTPGDGQIKSMVVIAGNPVLSTPNGKKLEEALKKLEFMVAIDFYLNETAQYAHIILPPTSPLEHEHYDLIFHALAVRNTAKFSSPVFAPQPDAKHDWEILKELHQRIAPPKDLYTRLLHKTTPQKIIDLGLKMGPYGFFKRWFKGLSLKKLKKEIHGVDLGPLQSCLPDRLLTKDKKIPLAIEIFIKDISRVEQRFFKEEKLQEMLLIGRRHLRSNNSWLHNSLRLVKGKERCTALIHPKDAKKYQLACGDRTCITTKAGSIEIAIEITEEIMPGVISIPHGWGHHRPDIKLSVAKEHPGVSLNDITDENFIDTLSGNAAVNGVPVSITKV